uniref:Uncharacterized protein n=1 Tax=Anguilla anguilla TaxID=7936 RepID=A0A0E9V968_ANGAN
MRSVVTGRWHHGAQVNSSYCQAGEG